MKLNEEEKKDRFSSVFIPNDTDGQKFLLYILVGAMFYHGYFFPISTDCFNDVLIILLMMTTIMIVHLPMYKYKVCNVQKSLRYPGKLISLTQ